MLSVGDELLMLRPCFFFQPLHSTWLSVSASAMVLTKLTMIVLLTTLCRHGAALPEVAQQASQQQSRGTLSLGHSFVTLQHRDYAEEEWTT